MYATFNRFAIQMTKEQALSASHPGPCDEDVKDLLNVPAIRRQFSHIKVDDIRAELREYGAWDDIELANDQANRERIVWIAACDIREGRG